MKQITEREWLDIRDALRFVLSAQCNYRNTRLLNAKRKAGKILRKHEQKNEKENAGRP